MRILVTGASGHVGNHVVRAAVAAGHTAVAFVRPAADRRALAGAHCEVREGDLLDAVTVRRAAEGVEAVIHVGAVHRNLARTPDEMMRPAVEGTRNVLDAARAVGARRVVVTSTGATIGFAKDPARPLDERATVQSPRSAYVAAKLAQERLALEAAGGPEVVVVNPSGVLGPRDWRLTPATRALVGLLQGDPSFLALCFTDVRDVASGHLLALERGRAGERYLLTGEVCTPRRTAELLGELAGVKPLVFRPPAFLLRVLVGLGEAKAAREGTDPPSTREAVDDLDGGHLAYDATRARSELGATFRATRDTLVDALRWLLFVGALKPKVAETVRATLGEAAAPDPAWS
ncbi:MAG: NAD-dependent epimerase/dehydratase family protein [Myxococcota bacterium]